MATLNTTTLWESLANELDSAIDVAKVEEAYDLITTAHAGQKRKSGEDYLIHPVEVARICAQLHFDENTIVAALLHDTVEDTDVTVRQLKQQFGAEVSTLVDGVTKLGRIEMKSLDTAQIENYRKIFIAMAADYRVILIKLADRLHNMRTIRFLSKNKQQENAQETLDIFAPIAHRLGISSVKWELEDLSFQVLHPKTYSEVERMLARRKSEREKFVAASTTSLEKSLIDAGVKAQITGRSKHIYSIYEKMERDGKTINEIYDLTGIRVLVDSTTDCYAALGVVHGLWRPIPGRVKDYIAMPKSNGYQSLHTTVVGPNGTTLEVQVRTQEMHLAAEYGIAAHFQYKKGGKAPSSEWLKRIPEWSSADPTDFMAQLQQELQTDEVYVFTPAGDVKALARDATPLDFAYAVHTDIGHRCIGAKINGKIVPLSYKLKNGDQVDIMTTRSNRGPSRDWLKIATTQRARSKIRNWFAKELREDQEERGREALLEALKAQGIPQSKINNTSLLATVMRDLGYKKAEDFYVALGSSKLTPTIVINKIVGQLKTTSVVEPEPTVARVTGRKANHKKGNEVGVVIEGIQDSSSVTLRMAACCHPVPGDPIKGYVSLGQGITVHHQECHNLQTLTKRSPDRLCNISWAGASIASFRAPIEVEAWDRSHLLEDISRAISESGGQIIENRGSLQDEMLHQRFVIEVGDLDTLRIILANVRKVTGVMDAQRISPSS